MKILLLMDYRTPECNPSRFLAGNLALLFLQHGYDTAVCAGNGFRIRNTSLYQAPALPASFFHHETNARTCEEELSKAKLLKESFLKQDLEAIHSAIQQSKPDLILEYGRPIGVIAAKQAGIPVFSFQNSALFRPRSVPGNILTGINHILDEVHQDQILSLAELYQRQSAMIFFGPLSQQPFPKGDVFRLGSMNTKAALAPRSFDKRVSIWITHPVMSLRRYRKIITDAFLGASYPVQVCIKGMEAEKNGNITFLSRMSVDGLEKKVFGARDSSVCIHDGNAYIFNQCMANGVRQLIINDGSWKTAYNAQGLVRAHAGMWIWPEEMTMENLYETYRRLESDDSFRSNALCLSEEALASGTLDALIPYLFSHNL